jgi:hypothetical protein
MARLAVGERFFVGDVEGPADRLRKLPPEVQTAQLAGIPT